MSSLYEISHQYQSIFNSIETETGEIAEDTISQLDNLSDMLEDKAIAIASFIKNLRAEGYAVADAIDAMEVRRMRLLNKIDYLSAYLKDNLENLGITEIKSSPLFTIKIKKNPVSVFISDEDMVLDNYKTKEIKEIIKIDKALLKKDLSAGLTLPGAELRTNTRLEIK
jgi:hypothetical protein